MLITSSVRKQLTKALALRTLANSAALVHEYLKLSQLYCQNSPHQEVGSDTNLTGCSCLRCRQGRRQDPCPSRVEEPPVCKRYDLIPV